MATPPVHLPEYVGTDRELRVLGRANTARTAVVAANGTAEIVFELTGGNQLQITRAVVECSGAISPEPKVRIYVGDDDDPRNIRSGTNSGLFDEADYPDDGLLVDVGRLVIFKWTGAPVGETVIAAIQYRNIGSS